MTENKEQAKVTDKKMYAESRGKYILIDGAKNFMFEFPATITIEENYAALAYLKDEVWKVIEAYVKVKAEKEAKEKEEKKKETEPEIKEVPKETK